MSWKGFRGLLGAESLGKKPCGHGIEFGPTSCRFAGFGKGQCLGIQRSIGRGVVEVAIAGGPWGVRCLLEEVRPLFYEEACLVPVSGAAEFAQVGETQEWLKNP
jgi:hypothetical protein